MSVRYQYCIDHANKHSKAGRLTRLSSRVVPGSRKLNCATLKTMNPSSLMVNQLSELTNDTFTECANELGSADGYSKEQLTALGAKVTEVRPSP